MRSSPYARLQSSSRLNLSTIGQDTSKDKWAESLPKVLYSRESDPLRVNSYADGSALSNASSTSDTTKSVSSGSEKAVRKITLSEEAELVQRCKSRRYVLREDTEAKELLKAKLELVKSSKEELERESKRRQEVHELEMWKKKKEAELLELQILKMKKELGIE